MANRGNSHPDRDIYNLFVALNQEQHNLDLTSIYEQRWRAMDQSFEGMKRKWEEFTGVPVPKKLKTSASNVDEPFAEQNSNPNHSKPAEPLPKPPVAKKIHTKVEAPKHPDDDIDIDNMLVADLRFELRKRGWDTKGRKKELQERFANHLKEAKTIRDAEFAARMPGKIVESTKKDDSKGASDKLKINEVASGNKRRDVVMEDVSTSGMNDSSKQSSVEVTEKPRVVAPSVAECEPSSNENLVSDEAKKHAPKSALKPSKYGSAIAQTTPINAKSGQEPVKVVMSAQKVGKPTPSHSDASDSSKSSASLSRSTPQPSAMLKTPGSTYPKTGSIGSAKMLEKKKEIQAATEARKARLAEIRSKSKPVPVMSAGSATKPPSASKYAASSALKAMATSSATKGDCTINKNYFSKIREKAAAEKAAGNPTAPSTSTAEVSKYPNASTSSSSSMHKKSATQVHSQSVVNPAALQSLVDPANKPQHHEEKPLSPMQTYEMSDREEESDSEDESDDESDQEPKKSIPLWAQKSNLIRALEKQFADGPIRLDPDHIFGEVITCNLEEIFDKKKARYQRRTSSGNWTKDHVTFAEKLTYKRTMGYNN